MAKLQLALDTDLETALHLLARVRPYIDIAEIGTPLIFREGMHGIRRIRSAYPDLALLADLKIMDAGEEEAGIGFDAGANLVTVMGLTNNSTIQGAVRCAHQHNGQIVVDLMGVENLIERSHDLITLGCDVLCVHTAFDLQTSQESPYHALKTLRQALPEAQLAIAGGVNLDRLDAILPHQPDIIIIGGGITRADDPAYAAKQLYERIKHHAH